MVVQRPIITSLPRCGNRDRILYLVVKSDYQIEVINGTKPNMD